MVARKTRSNGRSSLRVFIGASAGGEDAEACAVLEASLRRHASVEIELEWLRLARDPYSPCSGWRTERWSTPWTALRWAVPDICGFAGRAVYFDPASIIFGDVAELSAAEFPVGAFVLARRENSTLLTGCMAFDCEAAGKHLPPLEEMRANVGAHQDIGALLEKRPRLVGPLPGDWGTSDAAYARYVRSPIGGSVHFTSTYTQPHLSCADERLAAAGRQHWFQGTRLPHYCARLVALWEDEFQAAVGESFLAERYVPAEPWGPYLIGGADRVEGGRRVT